LNITQAKMLISLRANELGRSSKICKHDSDPILDPLIVTRVESFCEKRDSSRVTIFLNVTRVESKSPKIVTRVQSLTKLSLP